MSLTDTDIRQRIWSELKRAALDRHHEWRAPVLATVGHDGAPQARTVVLREADPKRQQLLIYTDSRSLKVADLAANPAAVLVFWSKRLGWQLRVRATTSVQTVGPEVDAIWERVRQSAAAADYLSVAVPGSALPAQSLPSDAQPTVVPKHHLALVTATVQEMDWLELARTGHRRAVLDAESWSWRVP